jgi:3-oxoacyl-[acyl-carrier protein] reductase
MIADIDERVGTDTVEAIGDAASNAVFHLLDVTDATAANAAAEKTVERFGRLDIHVNNAGVVHRAPFLDYGLATWQQLINVNLTGAFICGQASARAMAKAGRGRIINIASISGQQGGTGREAYGASKAKIISLTQTMAMELGPLGITVNAIAPGPTQVSRLSHGPKQREAFLRAWR